MSENETFKERVRQLGHLVCGFAIAMKGWLKFDDHHETVGVILMLLGALFVAVAILHRRFSWLKRHDSILFVIEGAALSFVSATYFSSGKLALPIIYAACAVTYFVLAVYFYKFRNAHGQEADH